MCFQEHKSAKGKARRNLKYYFLRCVGIPVKRAARFRDWTWPKVMMIAERRCRPI